MNLKFKFKFKNQLNELTKKPIFWCYLIMLGLVMGVFGSMVFHLPITIDDDYHVFDNPNMINVSWASFVSFWTAPTWGLYVPVVYSLWAILSQITHLIYGTHQDLFLHPFLFKFANLSFHLFNTFLVFQITQMLLNLKFKKEVSPYWAMMVALLFSLHPMQVESVVWLSGLKDVSAGFFFLLALKNYLSSETSLPSQEPKWRVWIFYFILSMLCKPTALVFPLFLILLDLTLLNKKLRTSLFDKAPLFLFSIPILVMTHMAQVQHTRVDSPLLTRPLIFLDSFGFYLKKIFNPMPLLVEYSRSPMNVLSEKLWLHTFIWPLLLLILFLFFMVKKKKPIFTLGIGIFFIWGLPVSGLLNFAFQFHSTVADRYMYLSLWGISLAVVTLIYPLFQRFHKKFDWVFSSLSFVSVFTLGILTSLQVDLWKDSWTLYTHNLKFNPKSALVHVNYGVEFVRKGSLQDGFNYNLKAHQMSPLYTLPLENLVTFSMAAGNGDLAFEYAQKLLTLNPGSAKGLLSMGEIQALKGQKELSSSYFARAFAVSPYKHEVYFRWAKAKAQAGLHKEALEYFQLGLQFGPGDSDTFLNIGTTLSHLGDEENSRASYEYALKLRPDFPEAFYNLGNYYFRKNEFAQAIDLYNRALKINPSFSLASGNLAYVKEILKKGKRK
jgi:tetratricopeptide (TPR) repeat protein